MYLAEACLGRKCSAKLTKKVVISLFPRPGLSMNHITDPVPADREDPARIPGKVLRIPRPVDQKGFALDLIEVDKAPVAAVGAVIAVVAHHEQRVFRNNNWSEIIPGRDLTDSLIGMHPIFVIQRLVVYVYIFVDNLDRVPRYPDNPFYVVLLFVSGIFKNNNIVSGRLFDWDNDIACKGVPYSINKFIDENVISD